MAGSLALIDFVFWRVCKDAAGAKRGRGTGTETGLVENEAAICRETGEIRLSEREGVHGVVESEATTIPITNVEALYI